MKKFAAIFFLIGFSIFITLFIVEIALRIFHFQFLFLPPLEPKGYVRFDSEIGYDIELNFPISQHSFADSSYPVWSNELSCFDKPYFGETPYIYLAGDSFVWGWTPFEEKWGKQIEKITGIRVLTCGVNGYGTRQEFIKTDRHLKKIPSPSLIIVGYTPGNDLDDDMVFPNYTVWNGWRVRNWTGCQKSSTTSECLINHQSLSWNKKLQYFLGSRSVMYNASYRVYARLINKFSFSKRPVFSNDASLSFHLESIRLFKQMSENHKAKLLFVFIPRKGDFDSQDVSLANNAKIRQFLENEKIRYLDLKPLFQEYSKKPEQDFYWKNDGHWNIEGNRLAGFLVAEYILKHSLIK